MNGDRPITKPDDDLLGFSEMATWLATAAVSDTLKDGFVVGIEGAWGSGKSSLVHLARHQWEAETGDAKPVIVDFNPWLVGERDALLLSLFDDLRRKIDGIKAEAGEPDDLWETKVKDGFATIDDVSAKLKKFGRRVAPLRYVAEAVAYLDMIPGATLAAKGLKRVEEASQAPDIEEEESVESLVDLKTALDESLAALDRRIIVVIDDLDRLEPKEIMEILRLVRSVADFKNVTYVLCYDNHIISEAISRAMQIDDGKKFLEKIVQLELKVPPIHSFTMTQLFRKELDRLIECPNADSRDRMARVVHHWGSRYLTTPRMLNKVLDTIRFAWPYLKDKVDGPDYVFLQLLRHGNPEYYDWVAHYVASIAGIEFGTKQSSTAQEEADSRKFFEIVEKESVTIDNVNELRMLRRILPKIADYQAGRLSHFYVAGVDGKKFLNGPRLGNFDHYRLYFSGYQPENSITHVDYQSLVSAANLTGARVARFFERAIYSGELGTLSLLFMELEPGGPFELSPDQFVNVLHALPHIMDHPDMVAQDNAVRIFLSNFAREVRDSRFDWVNAAENAEAISWMCRLIVERNQSSEEELESFPINDDVSRDMRQVLAHRLEKLDLKEVILYPRLHYVIKILPYAMHWDGNRTFVHSMSHDNVKEAIRWASDENFIKIMEGLAETEPDAGKITRVIDDYIGFEEAHTRLAKLSMVKGPLSRAASYLLDRFED